MMRWVIVTIVAVAAAACAPQGPMTQRELDELSRRSLAEQISRTPPDTCQAATHQSLVGTPEPEIDRSALPPVTRVICHDCSVTMDYRADRLNIELGPDGKVVRLRCG